MKQLLRIRILPALISMLLLTAILHTPIFSQNIVPNNGFETYTALPSGYGQWYDASLWNNVNMYPAFAWPYASPDYLHMTGSGGADLPVCTFATVTPYSGNAVMGFITWLASTPDFREYLSGTFTTPMVVGTTYTVSFWITNGSAGWYCGNGSNHLGIRFSTAPLTQLFHEPIGGTPQVEFPGEIWNTGWQYVSFTYVADQPYTKFTIGNFYNDASTTNTWHVASFSPGAYYFIDEVAVVPVGILPVTFNDFYAEADGKTALLEWNTASEINSDHFIIERSADGISFGAIGNVTAAGYSEQNIHYAYTDDAPLSGDNFYRLALLSTDGTTQYSAIRSVAFAQLSASCNIYPNPASDVLYIDAGAADALFTVEIITVSGEMILERSIVNHAAMDIREIPSGMYVIKVQNNSSVFTAKLIKN